MEKSLILTRAKSAAIAHDFVTAARMYKELLRDDQSNVDYLKQLGSIYVQAGEDEKAIPYYSQIITFYPHYVDAMNSLGAIYRRLKRYDESIAILQRALDEDRQLPAVNYNLGYTYREMGNYQDAIDSFEKVIRVNPDDVLAYNHLGSVYFALKQYEKSVSSYRRGLQIDQNHPILNYNLAKVYEAVKNNNDAVRCYKVALRTRPGWTDAIKDYTNLLMRTDNNKEAADIIQQGIKLYPNNAEMLEILGDIYLNDYDYSSAEKIFKKACSIKPDDVKALVGLSKALEKSDKSEYALDAAMSALELDPENKSAKKQYAQSLLSERDYNGAKEAVDDLYESDEGKKDLQVLDLRGQYFICNEEDAKAQECYDTIKRINHHYKDYMVNAANRYAQIGNYEKAEICANEFLVYRPDNIDGYNALGKINYLKEDYDKASEYYKKALSLGKNNLLAEKQLKTISDKIQREKLLAEKIEEITGENPNKEPEAQNETSEPVEGGNEGDVFDFDSIGGPTPLQEGLTQEEEDFWKQNEEDKEEPVEEEKIEEEIPEEEDISDPMDMHLRAEDSDSFDDIFGDKQKHSDPSENDAGADSAAENAENSGSASGLENDDEPVSEPVEEENPEDLISPARKEDEKLKDDLSRAADEDEEPFDLFKNDDNQQENDDLIDDTLDPLGSNGKEDDLEEDSTEEDDFDFSPYKSSEAQEEPVAKKPEPKSVPVEEDVDEAEADDYEEIKRMNKEAAEKAMETASKMAEQQQKIQEQTEEALKNALQKVHDLEQQKYRDQDEQFEEMMKNAQENPSPIVIQPPKMDDFLTSDQKLPVQNQSLEDEFDIFDETPAVESEPQNTSALPANDEKRNSVADEKIHNLAKNENGLSTNVMLEKIERILNDDDAAMNNVEKIEMFKKLRVLCDFLPESEKYSFQSCRNRMVIDYIIAKLSGKLGLLLTAQSLIKSGV